MFNYFDIRNTIKGKLLKMVLAPFMGQCGTGTKIISPLRMKGLKNFFLGSNVMIQTGTWLEALPLTGKECHLIMGNGCIIGHFNHIYATHHIEFGKNVLTADKVYITDNLHEYMDIEKPVLHQPVKQISKVYIGSGAWLGENVCIIGASVGKNSVIGANSVVTKDIPDYCVAVGIPARIIKRYDIETQKWEKTNENGEFIN